MKLTEYSKNRFLTTFVEYTVSKDHADVIFNYLVHGFQPGGFFTSLLANDAFMAFSRSHPGNSISAIKNLIVWIQHHLPKGVGYGSYEIVSAWLAMTESQRRQILEERGLVYSEQEEIMMVLKGEKTFAPFFFD